MYLGDVMQTARVDLKNQPSNSNEGTNYKMDAKTLKWATSIVARHLDELGPFLDQKYLSGEVLTEADIQFLTVSFLKENLLNEDGFWYIGAENYVGKNHQRPDIVCYYRKGAKNSEETRSPEEIKVPKEFFEHEMRQEMIVCVIEIKFATRKQDIKKLESLQDKLSEDRDGEILVWQIFGDHFNKNIHAKYAKITYTSDPEQMLEDALDEWKSEPKSLTEEGRCSRGFTLLKFGKHKSLDNFDQREYMNEHFWKLDRKSIYKQENDDDKKALAIYRAKEKVCLGTRPK
jgi:hypothetical protein